MFNGEDATERLLLDEQFQVNGMKKFEVSDAWVEPAQDLCFHGMNHRRDAMCVRNLNSEPSF